MKKLLLYFARPQNMYGTPLERALLALIAEKFPLYEIVNPSDQKHKDAVAKLREKDPKANVMPYFEDLVAQCDQLVAVPFGDGMLGAGVWAEAEKMLRKNRWPWVLDSTNFELNFVRKIPEALKLTVEETRARIRNPDGTPRPYV